MIYFLEDDDNIRKFVCYALAKEGYEVEGFSRPELFRKALANKKPRLLLLDIMLPEEDGLTILKKLRASAEYEDLPVIMVTAKTTEFDTVTGLDMGADDYIAKPFGMTELISRVHAVLRRYEKTKGKPTSEYRTGDLYVNTGKHTAEVSGESVVLSYKEYLLLVTLLEAGGCVVTRGELFDKVWGGFYGESRTLDVHIGKLRSKLKEAGALIQTVKNVGYKIGGDADE